MKSKQLTIEIVDDELRISIGKDVLAFACEYKLQENTEDTTKIIDIDKFTEAIRRVLQDDDEEGTTLVHEMLDKATMTAYENGEEGFN